MRRYGLAAACLAVSCEITPVEGPTAVCTAPTGVVPLGGTLTFSGTGSQPAQPGPLAEYAWSLLQAPDDSVNRLEGTDSPTATLIADAMGEYRVQLVVTDFGGNESEPCVAAYTVSTELETCADGSLSTDYPDGRCPPVPFSPVELFFEAFFAYDAERDVVRGYFLPDGRWVLPSITIELYEDGGDPADPETYCQIRLQAAEPAEDGVLAVDPAWREVAQTRGLPVHTGFALPSEMSVIDGCADHPFDPAVWGEDGPAALLGSLQWGAGINQLDATLHADLEAFVVGQLSQEYWDTEWEPWLFGAGLYRSDLDPAVRPFGSYLSWMHAFSYAVDDAFNVQWTDSNSSGSYEDGEDELTTVRSFLGGAEALPTGVYRMNTAYILNPACLRDPAMCPR